MSKKDKVPVQHVGVWTDGYTVEVMDDKKLRVKGIVFPSANLKFFMAKSHTKANLDALCNSLKGSAVNSSHNYGPYGSVQNASINKSGDLEVEIILYSVDSIPEFEDDKKAHQRRFINSVINESMKQLSAKFSYKFKEDDVSKTPIDNPDFKIREVSLTWKAHLEGCNVTSVQAFSAESMEQQKKKEEEEAAQKVASEAAEAAKKKQQQEASSTSAPSTSSSSPAFPPEMLKMFEFMQAYAKSSSQTPAASSSSSSSSSTSSEQKTATPADAKATSSSSSSSETKAESSSKPKAIFVLEEFDKHDPGIQVSDDGKVTLTEPAPSDSEKDDIIKLGFKKEDLDAFKPSAFRQLQDFATKTLAEITSKDTELKQTKETLTKETEEKTTYKRKFEEIEEEIKDLVAANAASIKKYSPNSKEPANPVEIGIAYQRIILEQNKTILEQNKAISTLAKEKNVKDTMKQYHSLNDLSKTAIATEAYSADKQKEKEKEKLSPQKGSLDGITESLSKETYKWINRT